MLQMMTSGESAFRPYYKPISIKTAEEVPIPEYRKSPYSASDNDATPVGKDRTRRKRTTFTPEQTTTLEKEYVLDRYMDRCHRLQLADRLSLSENQVKTWFQNRRAKDKKEGGGAGSTPGGVVAQSTGSVPQKRTSTESASASSSTDTSVESPPPAKRMSTESPRTSCSSDTPALVAALQSPCVSDRTSPSSDSRLGPTPPALTYPSMSLPLQQHHQPLAPPSASYSDYLSSIGLAPLSVISSPSPYPSVFELYSPDYASLLAQGKGSALLSAMALDPAMLSLVPPLQPVVTAHSDLTQL